MLCSRVVGAHRIRSLLPLLILLGPISIGADLSLPVRALRPGRTVLAIVTLSGSMGSVGGVQFDMQYDDSVLTLTAVPGAGARGATKNLYVQDLAQNLRRFLVIGINQNPLPDGNIVDLLVKAKKDAPLGSFDLTISNVTVVDIGGSAVPATGHDGTIMIDGGGRGQIELKRVVNARMFRVDVGVTHGGRRVQH